MSNQLVFKDEHKEIRKAQAIVTSRYKLNPLSLKFITTLISMVQKTDEPNKEYTVRVQDFTSYAGLKGNEYYEYLRESCMEIMSKPIYIGRKGTKDFLIVNWCSSIKYNEGMVLFKISDELLPYIIELKEGYLKYDIKNILPLKSEYSIRIYEWLKDEFNTKARYGKNAELILTVEEIRKRLEIPESYRYDNIRNQIFDKAKEDLEKHCDIKFKWEIASKIGKKVSHIRFRISRNIGNCKEKEELPPYLSSYMAYVNYLRERYKETTKHFMLLKLDLVEGNKTYLFGINAKGLIYATATTGGNSIAVNKLNAGYVYNASYIVAKESEIYRDFINSSNCFFEFQRDLEHKEYFGVVKNEIVSILSKKENDYRTKHMF